MYTIAMHEKRELWKMGILATCQLSGKVHLKLWDSFQAVNRLTHSLWDGVMKKLTIRPQCCTVGLNAVGHTGLDSAVASSASVDRKSINISFSCILWSKRWLTSVARWFLQLFMQGFAAKRSLVYKAIFISSWNWQADKRRRICFWHPSSEDSGCNDSRLKRWRRELFEVPLMLSLETLLTLGKNSCAVH